MMITPTEENVKLRMLNLFETKMFQKFDEDKMDLHFFNSKIGMQPRHLLYLFFFIESEFDIEIHQQHIISGQFSTFNNLCSIILQELKKEHKQESITH